jgi:Protein of unknown function (DUF3631)
MTNPTLNQVKDFAAKLAATAKLQSIDSKALYTYQDETGAPLYWRVRADCHATGDKFIRPFYWSGTGFEAKEPPAPPEGKPLYGLQRLALKPAAVVIVCEGEKATDALNKYFKQCEASGVLAVTSGGASSAGAANWQPLNGHACFVFPDHDEAGAKYAHEVIAALQGIAASAAVLDISGLHLPPKGDAVEWLAAGGDIDGLMLLIDATRSPKTAFDDALIVSSETQQEQTVSGDGEQLNTPEAAPVEVLEVIESEADIITRCANLNPLAYDRIKKATAELLGVTTGALDKAVRLAQKNLQDDDEPFFELVEPHPHPINPAALLSELSDTVKRFIVCPDETADAAAVWIAFTWFIEVVEVAPIAVITAPEKRCGKSMLLFLIGRLSRDALTASNISPAALYRSIELWQPTLLIDEADAFMRDNEELRGLLNCGHTRDSAFTIRCVGDDSTPTRFNLWGAKAIAGIGTLADTLMDRAICLELRRKTPEEVRERLRHAPAGLFEGLCSKLARFRDDYSEAVRTARPNLPQSLNDRAQDNWSGLLAIASCAGDAWLERATAAALKLSGEKANDTQSIGNELLADIQTIFEAKRLDKISTADLIAALCEDEELSWNTYNRGKPLSPRQLSKRLGDYGISSKTIRINAYETPKGFSKDQFSEAFSRYLSDPLKNAALSATPPQVNNDGLNGVADMPPQNAIRHTSATPFAPPLQGCGGVAAKNGKSERNGKTDFVEFAV